MTAIRYVTTGEMTRKTGMPSALGYAFPDEDEIWIRKGLPEDVEQEVRAHEAEHIEKGEEGPFLGALIGAGASILGGVLGSKSSSKAAKAQAQASREAIAYQRESRDLALEYQRPYRDASYTATAALMDMTGLSRGTPSVSRAAATQGQTINIPPELRAIAGSGFGIFSGIAQNAVARAGGNTVAGQPPDTAPNLADYPKYQWQTDPGYEFRMGEGMKALERGAAARGGLLSGGFARKALRYAQNYASNEYQNVYNRIASIAGFGQVATNNSTGVIMGAAGNVGNALMNAGEARASGYMAQGNAWANAINQISQIDWDGAFGGQTG